MELAVLPKRDPLIERCLGGDMQGYQELYNRYAKAMYNTCLRLLNNSAEAEHVLQESFMEAFKNLVHFENKTSFGGWLKQICINRSINQLKKRRINWVQIEQVNGIDHAEESLMDATELNLQVATVKKAIAQLPDGYRTVLSLYLLEGYDHEEISEILQVAPSTTRTQFIRAKQKLIQLLKEGV